MTLEFDPAEFDEWAASYDEETRAESGFPFEGYTRILARIAAAVQPAGDILDLGAGTGTLSALLARRGARLWCLDFSEKMLAIARGKLPDAQFAVVDARGPWPSTFRRRYSAIVSAYTFHHFPLTEKIALLRGLLNDHLLPNGQLAIGDISFLTAAARNAYRARAGSEWDEEYCWLADETLPALTAEGWQVSYEQVSPCAGVYVIASAFNQERTP